MKALVKSWLLSQPEDDRRMLETFLEDHFYKALDWVLKQNEFVVETSLVGVVMNGLSHMHGVKVKQEFACALIRGLGANLSSIAKTAFAKEVCILLEPLLHGHLNCLDFCNENLRLKFTFLFLSIVLLDLHIASTSFQFCFFDNPFFLLRCFTGPMKCRLIKNDRWTHIMTVTEAGWLRTN